MTIAITAATGQLGRLATAALVARGADNNVIALARDPAKAADLGVETRMADYTKTDTLVSAVRGVETLVLISSSDFNDRAGQHRNVIAAAKAAGVGRLIYTSILKGDASPLLLAADHKVTEADIKSSGLDYTILRNGWYTENYTGNLGPALAAGQMIGSAGTGRLSTAARADYAEAIAVTAIGAGHGNRTYELGGDTAYALADMAAEVSRLTGKQIPYNDLPPEAYAGILESFGLPSGFAAMIADADARASEGALFDDSGILGRLIGRPTTTMAASVAAGLA